MNIREGYLLEEITSHAIIANPCNNISHFGQGFAYKVGLKYPLVRKTFVTKFAHELGEIECIKVTSNLIIVNSVFLQATSDGSYAISYPHLEKCLDSLKAFATMMDKPIHLPKLHDKDNRSIDIISKKLPECTVWALPVTNKNTNLKF